MLGVPAPLAPFLFAQALSRLLLVYGAISIIFAEVLFLIVGISTQHLSIVIIAIGIGCAGFPLSRMLVAPSRTMAFIYLGMLAVTLTLQSWQVLSLQVGVASTYFEPFALVSFAMIAVCGVSVRATMRAYWAILAFILANLSLWVGAVLASVTKSGTFSTSMYVVDYRFVVGSLIVIVTIFLVPRLLESNKRIQSTIDKIGDVVEMADRESARAKSTAMNLHDTLLATLALLSSTPQGTLSPAAKTEIESQLASLHAFEVFDDEPTKYSSSTTGLNSQSTTVNESPVWGSGAQGIIDTIEQSETKSFVVHVNGDISALDRLTSHKSEAVAGAVGQCLTNAKMHSGQNSAEVVVLSTPEQITITVIDSGTGFDPADVPADRLGLRMSVIERIEATGGNVRILSTENSGTAVLMHVPVGGA